MRGSLLSVGCLIAAAWPLGAQAQVRAVVPSGFESLRLDLTAAGETSLSAMENDCTGYVTRQPAVLLNYPQGGAAETLEIRLESQMDTVLAVLLPGERLDTAAGHPQFCSDDEGGGVNPAVRIPEAPAGDYRIYPGAYARDVVAPAVLIVRRVPPAG